VVTQVQLVLRVIVAEMVATDQQVTLMTKKTLVVAVVVAVAQEQLSVEMLATPLAILIVQTTVQ
jgi:hypothetical protein